MIEPDRITRKQFEKIVDLFGDAARRARDCGFNGVQIHAAHFFFLSRYISPATNNRGNRIEILKRILQKIREISPELHVSMKLNSSDFTPGGLDENQSMEIAEEMASEGIDSIEVSGNGTSVAGIRSGKNEGYFFEFARDLSEKISIPVILVGGHRSIEYMDAILNASKIEFLSLSRPLICEPDLINRWKSGDFKPSQFIELKIIDAFSILTNLLEIFRKSFPLICEPDLINRWQSGDFKPSQSVSCNSCYRTQDHRCVFNFN